MKIQWEIEEVDIARVAAFYKEHENNELVAHRYRTNIEGGPQRFSRAIFWKEMVSCLLTTQQRSGPTGAVSRFNTSYPFPLNYSRCRQQRHLKRFVQKTLSDFGGIRRSGRLSMEIDHNLKWLEDGGWQEVEYEIGRLRHDRTQQSEVRASDFIDDSLKGFGPKQARNLLQGLGLTKYEIPIDSRITKWLNKFGFPIELSATALSDRNYYRFVSRGFRELCDACDLYPCLLDAAIFLSYDQ
jgi:hypothetical protein